MGWLRDALDNLFGNDDDSEESEDKHGQGPIVGYNKSGSIRRDDADYGSIYDREFSEGDFRK